MITWRTPLASAGPNCSTVVPLNDPVIRAFPTTGAFFTWSPSWLLLPPMVHVRETGVATGVGVMVLVRVGVAVRVAVGVTTPVVVTVGVAAVVIVGVGVFVGVRVAVAEVGVTPMVNVGV